jgi:hypothetical protein
LQQYADGAFYDEKEEMSEEEEDAEMGTEAKAAVEAHMSENISSVAVFPSTTTTTAIGDEVQGAPRNTSAATNTSAPTHTGEVVIDAKLNAVVSDVQLNAAMEEAGKDELAVERVAIPSTELVVDEMVAHPTTELQPVMGEGHFETVRA